MIVTTSSVLISSQSALVSFTNSNNGMLDLISLAGIFTSLVRLISVPPYDPTLNASSSNISISPSPLMTVDLNNLLSKLSAS